MKHFCSVFPLLFLLIFPIAFTPAFAATVNPSPASPGYMTIPITMNRAVTTVSAPVIARIKAPWPLAVVGITASLETGDFASTDEHYKIDVKEGATSILTTPLDLVAADTVYSAVVTDKAIADEAVLTVILDVTGTTPSVEDVTCLLVLKRL